MLSFKQFLQLDESMFSEKKHRNPSIATLKALAANNRDGIARFTHEPKSNVTYGGDAHQYTHDSLSPEADVTGYIYHKDGKHTYAAYHGSTTKSFEGPLTQRFEKYGMSREKHPYDLEGGWRGKKMYMQDGGERVCWGGGSEDKYDEGN